MQAAASPSVTLPPRVSVIVAAYNCGPYIEQALRSVIDQTCVDWELIVVNDGSTDDTGVIAERLAEKDGRIRMINQANSGTAAGARNTGVACARGTWLCFLDGDDFYDATRLNVMLGATVRLPGVRMLFHDFRLTDQHGTPMAGSYLGGANYLERAGTALVALGSGLYRSNLQFYPYITCEITSIWTGSVMIERALLQEESEYFVADQAVGEDIDLWFRLAARCEVGYIDQVLSFYRQHSGGITRRVEAVSVGFLFAHERNYRRAWSRLSPGQRLTCRDKLAAAYFSLAWQRAGRGALAAALRAYLASFRYRPRAATVRAILKTLARPLLRH